MHSDEPRERISVLEVSAFVGSYWRRLPRRFGLIVVGAVVAVLIDVLIPTSAAALVGSLRAFYADAAPMDPAWTAMWLLVGLFALRSLVQQGYLRIWMYVAAEVMHTMVADGFNRVQRFSTDWHTNNFAGSTQRKITRGMWAYDTYADTVVVDLGPSLLMLVGFAAAMFLREPTMGLYFTGSVAAFLFVSIYLSLTYVAPANQHSNDADTKLGGCLADAVTCNTVIKAFGSEAREEQRLFDVGWEWRRRARAAWTRSMDAGAAQSLMIVLLLAGLLGIVLTRAESGAASLEDLVFVITTYFIIQGNLRNIGWQVRNLQRAVNELDDLVEIAKTAPQVADIPNAPAFKPGPGALQLDNVQFHYTNQPTPLYRGLSVDIRAGERVALVGESGSGKSTFVKVIQRLYDLNGGRILIDGQDIAGVQQESLRRNIALVPQDPVLFHRTLLENIRYARPDASYAAVVEASRKAHAHEFIERLETGYETLVGERGIKLSGGERQRVAIARAILADTPLLIMDEATSSLDSITEQLIQDAIATLMEDRTSILIAHRLSTIRKADRILVFDHGQVIEEGNHRQLIATPGGAYRRMYEMQYFSDDLAEDASDMADTGDRAAS